MDINRDLDPRKYHEIIDLIEEFNDVMSEKPGFTELVKHDIILTSTEPVKSKIYPVPLHLRKYFEKEVDKLLEMGIIRPSTSPFCSSPVMVPKRSTRNSKETIYRMAIDYLTYIKLKMSFCL